MIGYAPLLGQVRIRLGQAEMTWAEFTGRWGKASDQFRDYVRRLRYIDRDFLPPKELFSERAIHFSSGSTGIDYKWIREDGGIKYIQGEPLQDLVYLETVVTTLRPLMEEAERKTAERKALTQPIEEEVKSLLIQIGQALDAIPPGSVSAGEKDLLQRRLHECEGFGFTKEAIECLRKLLVETQALASASMIPTWAYVVGSIALIGGGLWLAGVFKKR